MVGTATSIGPVREDVRDRLKELRDKEGHPNYNAALEAILDEKGV